MLADCHLPFNLSVKIELFCVGPPTTEVQKAILSK